MSGSYVDASAETRAADAAAAAAEIGPALARNANGQASAAAFMASHGAAANGGDDVGYLPPAIAIGG